MAHLVAMHVWFVGPTPIDRSIHKLEGELYRGHESVGVDRHIAVRHHRLGHPITGTHLVPAFVREPDPDEPGEPALFVYTCPCEKPREDLDQWAQTYRTVGGLKLVIANLRALASGPRATCTRTASSWRS